MRRALDNLPII